MSSGTDDDDEDDDDDDPDDDEIEFDGQGSHRMMSEDGGKKQGATEVKTRLSEMNYSQHDSEICKIKVKAESMYNFNPNITNIDNASQKNNDHFTQLAGKSKKEMDEIVSTKVKQAPLTVAPSPMHRGESTKMKKQ